MASFNHSTQQMTVKVVYYGPGLCGKTTNLQFIYDHTTRDSRGEMISLETQTDRTLFFDLLPLQVGSIAGFKTRVQLYTVPGQVFYNTTRKLVLKGVDGIVFVADSQRPMLKANVESLVNLEKNFAELGLSRESLPLVFQYNKRDLKDICSVEELDEAFQLGSEPRIGAAALSGSGVFETLREISKLTLRSIKRQIEMEDGDDKEPTAELGEDVEEESSSAPIPEELFPENAASPAEPEPGRDAISIEPDADVEPVEAPEDEISSSDLVLEIDSTDLGGARRITFDLCIEDGEGKPLREIHDVLAQFDHPPAGEEFELRLRVRLGPEE